jgi:hypothetical protein
MNPVDDALTQSYGTQKKLLSGSPNQSKFIEMTVFQYAVTRTQMTALETRRSNTVNVRNHCYTAVACTVEFRPTLWNSNVVDTMGERRIMEN